MTQDYLLTYNPNIIELHPDSSDFESCVLPLPHIKNKPGYHRLVKSSFGSKARNIYYNKADCQHLKNDNNIDSPVKECQASSSLLCQKTNKCYGHSNRGDPSEKRPSRICVLRQKVLPRFSTIFRLSASNKPVVKLQDRKLARTSCQQCQTCLRRRNKKPNARRDHSIVHPVYAFEAGVHVPKVHIPNDGPRNVYSFTSTSDSGNPEKLRRKNSKFKKRFRMEMMREHWNYQLLKQKHQKHPNTPADHKPVHQVFSSLTRCHQSCLASSISDYSYMAEMPSAGFWDFLFDKIQTKYRTHKCEVKRCSVKPCPCDTGILKAKPSLCYCDPRNPCYNRIAQACQSPSPLDLPKQGSPMSRAFPECNDAGSNRSGSSLQKPKVKCKCKPPATKNPKSQGTSPKSSSASPNGSPRISLQDYPQGPLKSTSICSAQCAPVIQKSPTKCCSPACKASPIEGKTCQEDHDQIKNMLTKKYNGEILCIHNPPCILINGCLNLPATTVEQTTNSFWPVLFKNIPIKKHARKVKREKSCQYGQCKVQQARVPKVYEEEKMQSLYSHVPPCDLIRSCDKKKYHPSLDNSHVPLYTKHADSVVNRSPWGSLKNYVCDHFPKCQELPIDQKTYDLLNGTESFGVQAQQDTSRACRHTPPCIMVPKCMGGISALNNYMQYEAIPDCSHSPICENIPACCRKNNKEMVSVSSQYPHSCRIV